MSLIRSIGFYSSLAMDFSWELTKNVFGFRRDFDSKTKLDGKVVVITGANTGIGKETAYQLSLIGAKLIIGCRDLEKGQNAVKDIKEKNPTANINLLKLDLSSLMSVRMFAKSVAEQEPKVDILINNAGVMMCPEWQTEDGFEMQLGTNHLGHFLLTLSLLPLIRKSPNPRILTVSSKVHELGDIDFENIHLRNGTYTPLKAYAQSKLANVLFTRELAKRLGPDSHVKAYCLHPGIIHSDLSRHMPFQTLYTLMMTLFYIDVEKGAKTTLYCAVDPSLENESGLYYDDCKRVDKMQPKAVDTDSARRLWELSCVLVKLEDELRI